MNHDKRKYWYFALALALSFTADQLTKIWARASLRPLHGAKVVIAGFFDFRYSENTGSAFGLFHDLAFARYLLFAIGVVALVVIATFLRRANPQKPGLAAWLGLLAGGAVGNIVDRAIFGRVTDFIVWKYRQWEWPTFNVADAALVVGIVALLLFARGEDLQPRGVAEKSAK